MAFSRCFPCLFASVAVSWAAIRILYPSQYHAKRERPHDRRRHAAVQGANLGWVPQVRAWVAAWCERHPAHVAACLTPGTRRVLAVHRRCLACGGAASQSRTKIVSDTPWHRVTEASSSAACGAALEGRRVENPSANLNAGGSKDKHDGGAGCMDFAADTLALKLWIGDQ